MIHLLTFVCHSIAAEQRETERRKREFQEEEMAIAVTKRKLKQESTEVLLGVSTTLCMCIESVIIRP